MLDIESQVHLSETIFISFLLNLHALMGRGWVSTPLALHAQDTASVTATPFLRLSFSSE